jgi:type II secretory pathway component PulJ
MKKSIPAFSLVEMLITIGILAIVMLIATQTLNTIFKVSTISRFKTITRNEVGFSLELVERLLANSNVVDVYLYDLSDSNSSEEENITIRKYDEVNGVMVDDDEGEVSAIYQEAQLENGELGTEIHIRPYGYNIWVCIGYFSGTEDNAQRGYLLKRTMVELDGHQSCFAPGNPGINPILSLTSEDVKVNDFKVSYIKSTNLNNVFYVDLTMEPTSWAPGDRSVIKKEVVRQAVITTKGLTWY